MLKQRTNTTPNNQLPAAYKSKPSTQQLLSYQQNFSKNHQKQQKQNAIDRLEYIRKKYSSKQKDQALKTISQTKNLVHVQEYKAKEQVREQSKSYIRECYRDLRRDLIDKQYGREDQKEYTGESSMTRVIPDQKSSRPVRREYSYYKGVSRVNQQQYLAVEQADNDNRSTSSYRPSNPDSSFPRSTSAYFGARGEYQRDISCEKVSKRVENIDKINDRIKSILSVTDGSSFGIISSARPSLISESKIKPFKEKKAAYIYQTQMKMEKSVDKKDVTNISISKLEITNQSSSNEQIVKQLSILKVENYESQNFINEPHCPTPQKYTPRKSQRQKQKADRSKPRSNQLQTLMYKLSIQIQHDQNLRTSKYFFLLSTLPDKYQKLAHQLLLKGAKYTLQKLKQIMKFTEQEYNPFIYQSAHEDFGKFADTIIVSNQYWEKNILNRFDYEKLKQEKIDRILVFENKEDELVVADFARFVNLGSGNLYKNRDLVLIARRIWSNENELSVEKIFKVFCNNFWVK